jgi:DnaK suppressor protein
MNNPAAVLEAKRKELQSDLARLQREVRNTGEPEVRDSMDDVTSDEISAEAVDEITEKSNTLEQVQDALKRVADGTYGTCVACGRRIPPARLEAVPWTPYCVEDQEKIDRAHA